MNGPRFCPHCGVRLSGYAIRTSEYLMELGGMPHSMERCRDALKGELERVREAAEDAKRCTGHLVHDEYVVCPVHDR